MKLAKDFGMHNEPGRTPHGVRGLKYRIAVPVALVGRSHPARGAWIEILPKASPTARTGSRTPHGVRGLK